MLVSVGQAKVQPQEFYRNGLQYLAYAKVESVDKEEKALLAYDLSLAALVGEEIFNFGELIENQVFDALQGTPNAWLGLVLKAFNHGNIREWKALEQQYASQLNQTPILLANQKLMEDKIAILGVMELLFTRGSVDRSVTFEQVSQVTQRPLDRVEHLLMRALSLGLIRGSIDQTNKTIHITWVQPRVLNIEQIASMKNKLVEWKGRVKEALTLVENQMTPELIS
jgi:26S proteasome regulatory subunit N9